MVAQVDFFVVAASGALPRAMSCILGLGLEKSACPSTETDVPYTKGRPSGDTLFHRRSRMKMMPEDRLFRIAEIAVALALVYVTLIHK